MKKLLIVLLTFSFVLTLSSCEETPEEVNHEVPAEEPINLNELPYGDYLSLNNPVVTITIKGMGDIKIQLFPDVAPNTVNSFIQYIEDEAYTESSFHRVIDNFMIQGGRLTETACNIPGEMTEQNELNDLLHFRGVLSMARVGNDLDSATSQFFIVQANSHHLDSSYTGFGGLVSGFNVVDYISNLETDNYDMPKVDVTITSITVDLKTYVPEDRICAE